MKKNVFLFFIGCFILLFSPAIEGKERKKNDSLHLSSINLLDRNGLSQTISAQSRLSEYEKINFLSSQPYQKVMRIYEKEKNGDIRAQITSYHLNGQIKQYLDVLNNRAFGTYCEWFANGKIKIQARVIGGIADLSAQAEESWLFDGPSWAWDEEGRFIADIVYSQGMLEGVSRHFHPNGQLWKWLPYHQGALHGTSFIYLEDGTLLQTISYSQGLKDGWAYRYWHQNALAYEENYQSGKIIEGNYYSSLGELLSQIQNGSGIRSIFSKNELIERQEYNGGYPEGLVEIFDSGQISCCFTLKNGEKDGLETYYYPKSSTPKCQITWSQGELHGGLKTWYPEGTLESQREMSHNLKNGLLTAWYRSGSLMLVEEYENDLLVKGEYYRPGEPLPISKIEEGKGIAYLFNGEGNFSKKIHYREGRPLE